MAHATQWSLEQLVCLGVGENRVRSPQILPCRRANRAASLSTTPLPGFSNPVPDLIFLDKYPGVFCFLGSETSNPAQPLGEELSI